MTRPDPSTDGHASIVPAPTPDMVTAARAHVTGSYAVGVDRLLWETRRRPLSDLDAVAAVVQAATSSRVDGPDMAAALILAQAARLDLDRLEADLLDAVHHAGMDWQTIAVVLGLPDGEAARRHRQHLAARRAVPVAAVPAVDLGHPSPPATSSGTQTT